MVKIFPFLFLLWGCVASDGKVYSGSGTIHLWGEDARIAVSDSPLARQRGFFGHNQQIFAPGISDGMPSLTAISPPYVGEAVIGRAIDVPLLAMPYLSWQWNVEALPRSFPPARIIIGLKVKGLLSGFRNSGVYPAYDRLLEVPWLPPFDKPDHDLDLAALYKQNWPQDAITQVDVVFFAFWVNNQASNFSATLTGPVLYR